MIYHSSHAIEWLTTMDVLAMLKVWLVLRAGVPNHWSIWFALVSAKKLAKCAKIKRKVALTPNLARHR